MKRFFDFFISFFVLVLISPLLILTVILIKLTSKGSVFFKQERVGRNGDLFFIYKFRTMVDRPREHNKQVFKNDSEVTFIGKVIRRVKIDELPQLFNVLIGDMSLVGPRPCLPSLVKDFNETARKRLQVRPGLTGLAQVNGNIYLTWEQRWEFDSAYVEGQSFFLDMKIIFRTILIVIFGEQWGKKE